MEALLLPPSPEPQNQITNSANSKPNHQSGDVHKDETMMMKKKKDTNPSNLEKRKLKGKKKEIMDNDEASSSYCSTSSTSNSNSTKRVTRVVHRLRNPMRLGMARRSVGERQAEKLAKPLGFSLAAFANMVIARKNAAGQNVYVDDLVEIFATLVEESLANVYGNKLGSFATNFEQTFSSTLKILKLTNECANPHQSNNNDGGSCNLDRSTIDGCSDTELFERETSSATSAYEVMQGSATATSLMNELALFEETLQLSCVPPRSSAMALTTDERFLKEQTRANDLKTVEIGLQIRELRCKETALGLKFESNNLGKAALELDVSKAAFRAEKFKTELEDTRKEEMVTRIMDWLLVSVFSMLASMVLGVYNFSIKRIEDATSVCDQSEEKSSSWWVPKQVSSINSGFNTFICRVRVWVQIFFGVLMIIVFTYFLNKRSSGTKQTMPISFIVLFLGIFCGVSGKLCVDTLGGDGKLWLIVWEVFCLLQFVANVFTLALYGLMFGPINVTQETRSNRCNSMFPYWARRSVVYVVILFVLPVINGLLPFATFGEWRDFAMYHLHGGSDYA